MPLSVSRTTSSIKCGAQSFLPTLLISFHAVASPLDLDGLISRYREGGRALNQMIDRAEAAALRV